jgi:DNA-binding NtrC family response regulator
MMVVAVGITSEEVRSLAGKAPAARAGRIPGLLKCLVVSGDADLRHRLDTMADLAGWSACEAPADAAELRSLIDGDYHLVIADIARPLGERVNDTVEIAEEFASRPNTLVVVCGSGESVDEELWARQLGAWVYLPGVSGGDALMSLFGEAQRVVERRGVFQFV